MTDPSTLIKTISFILAITNMSRRQQVSAAQVLTRLLDSLDALRGFLIKHDWSGVLSKFGPQPDRDLVLISLLPRCNGEQMWEAQLRRLLGERYLAIQADRWLAQIG